MFVEETKSFLVHMVPLRQDNYAYILEFSNKQAVMIDSTLKEATSSFLEQHGLQPIAILLTHHHYDHADQLSFFQNKYNCKIYCSAYDSKRSEVEGQHTVIKDQETLRIAGTKFQVLTTPGHTKSHLSFYFPDENILFCGDTLFSLGCGRIFEKYENVYEDFFNSFQKIKSVCNSKTKIYCAHEYTQENLSFLQSQGLANKEAGDSIKERLEQEGKTIPTTLEYESLHNSFFKATNVESFKRLRDLKDKF